MKKGWLFVLGYIVLAIVSSLIWHWQLFVIYIPGGFLVILVILQILEPIIRHVSTMSRWRKKDLNI
ncbi:MAG: hypothetical protein PHE43_00715 [Candidatus Nanoarchaeia archaeon]|nr:hypothetical protein [Candidatus Nanoarchaeia archaeon]